MDHETNLSPFEKLANSATSGEYRFLARVIAARGISLQEVASRFGKKQETILASFSVYGKPSVSATAVAKMLGLNQVLLRAAQADDGSTLNVADLKQLHSDAIMAIQSSGLLPGVSDQLAADVDVVLRKHPSVRRVALRRFLGAWIPLLGPSITLPVALRDVPPAVYALLQVLREAGLLELELTDLAPAPAAEQGGDAPYEGIDRMDTSRRIPSFWRPFPFPGSKRGDKLLISTDVFPIRIAIVSKRDYERFLSGSLSESKFKTYTAGPLSLSAPKNGIFVIVASDIDSSSADFRVELFTQAALNRALRQR